METLERALVVLAQHPPAVRVALVRCSRCEGPRDHHAVTLTEVGVAGHRGQLLHPCALAGGKEQLELARRPGQTILVIHHDRVKCTRLQVGPSSLRSWAGASLGSSRCRCPRRPPSRSSHARVPVGGSPGPGERLPGPLPSSGRADADVDCGGGHARQITTNAQDDPVSGQDLVFLVASTANIS